MRSLRSQIVQCAVFLGVVILLWRGFFGQDGDSRPSPMSQIREPKKRAEFVRDEFIYGWKGYHQHAFPHDMLKPLTNTVLDDRYVHPPRTDIMLILL